MVPFILNISKLGFLGGSVGRESTCNAGDTGDSGSIPRSGRSPGGWHGYPFQYSCLDRGKDMDTGGWWATVRRVTVSDMTEATENACMQTNLWTYNVC